MADIELSNVSLRIKRGNIENLPSSAPDGELLLTTNTDGSKSLYCGTGTSVMLVGNNDTLNQTQITNCILEIPQNIKFELTNGVLKLKAGSKVYIPNGVNNFDTETISNDITVSLTSSSGTYRVFYRKGSNLAFANQLNVKSGSTPTSNIQGMYYDITLNKISFYQNNTTGDGRLYTFPLAEVTITNGVCTSINQIFNGLGYIGSTVFLLPNLKVLLCDGRNADGTLNNYELNISKCLTYTTAVTLNNGYFVIGTKNGVTIGFGISPKYETDIPNTSLGTFTYNRADNYIYTTSKTTTISKRAFIASISVDSGNITSFKANYPFRAVDYNDFYELQENALNKTQITNCILEAPNGVVTFSGSTITVKSGLKVLIPNGRNADGTLKNIEYTLNSDRSETISGSSTRKIITFVVTSNIITNEIFRVLTNQVFIQENTPLESIHNLWYKPSENVWRRYIGDDWVVYTAAPVAHYSVSNGTITALTPYEPFRAMDYNDFINNGLANVICTTAPTTTSTASAQTPAVVVENYVNGTSGYYVRSDGYCEQWGLTSENYRGTVTLLKPYINADYNIGLNTKITNGSTVNGGESAIGNVKVDSFDYSIEDAGQKQGGYWVTRGYIK